jgi:hypothetical protein
MAWCRHLSGGDRLGGYTHGECVSPNRIGRARWRRAFAWPVPVAAFRRTCSSCIWFTIQILLVDRGGSPKSAS